MVWLFDSEILSCQKQCFKFTWSFFDITRLPKKSCLSLKKRGIIELKLLLISL